MSKTQQSIKQALGSKFERIAEKHLLDQGLQLLVRNFSCSMGEIDLIMLDKETLVFVEVRYRNNANHGNPLETITRSKQRKIVRTAQAYLKITYKQNSPCRFDAIGITKNSTPSANGEPFNIDWIPGAFYS